MLALLFGARRYYRNWGSTKSESQMALPGDSLAGDPAIQSTEAVYIDATLSEVWPLLLKVLRRKGAVNGDGGAEGRAAVGGHNSGAVPVTRLEVGDRVSLAAADWMGLPDGMTFNVVEIVPEKYLVLTATRPDLSRDAVWSFHLQPHWEDRVRLLVRARIGLRHPGEVFVVELLRPLIALGTRALLLGIKRHAERPHYASPTPLRPVAQSLGDPGR
ncbi:SRPBCC family protein [Mycobacterium shigaense]|uniref:SRPBCC family protein n=1 Tax=Mycobacterium shigaense TaxID=722731 RepID=A0A1Z4EJ40_9MYCO|nr:SRPBCC family protein [Mycobacterium shigaense]MEA1124004.1 SRPBCC family protein [Mycobacterium shigaense]BAX92984.1 hypothetical protein MSG_02840 [Mycobacterium shigaense]